MAVGNIDQLLTGHTAGAGTPFFLILKSESVVYDDTFIAPERGNGI